MQFEALQVFCDVARHRSFSLAAQAFGRTQSAVSQIVREIERRLGVQLVNRSTRPLQLTPLGQVYYDGCKRLIEQYQELEASIQMAQLHQDSTVRVAAIYSVGLGDIGQLVEQFTSQQPHVKVQVECLHPDRVYERVLDGTADLGLVSFPRKTRELSALPWREEEMVVACAPSHPLAQWKSVAPAQLIGHKCIGFDKGLTIRREVDRFLRAAGVVPEVVLEFDNIENIKKAVEIGAGCALLPEPTLWREVRNGSLVAVPLTGRRLLRPVGIILRRQARLNQAAAQFVDLLRQPTARNGSAGSDTSRSGVPHRSRNGTGSSSKRKKAKLARA
jgi:DNA-binding transcriptional LysR family regulator